ncbi:PIG-L deacetylase family protein [Microvirga pakistanensis]|uniref:PIG-L deacetylase family protein n=1 Tax=Microvirga pakistanensis TaxID=1682650 RepID=UPI00106CAD42|nr:PIG-L deacetylase family protein [Microvirga pakistanensis]
MKALDLAKPGQRLSVLCLGAHSDDIEIGAGGMILQWIASGIELDIHWCVLSATGVRAHEAETSAAAFLAGASRTRITLAHFRDGFFPYQGSDIKPFLEDLRRGMNPDIVLTHRADDAHQDHREVSRLTWNTFRDHLVLEYEIPKWDGDLGRPNVYVPLQDGILERKIELLLAHFGTQRSKDWFDAETFRGLSRLRGMECRSVSRYAEAFFAKKVILG